MRRSLWFALGAVCVLASVIASPGYPALAQADNTVGIRLLDAPQNRADDPRARLYIVDHLAPGTTIKRRVEVGNDTAESQQVELYAGSATIEESEFRFGEGREPNDLTTWTTLAPPNLTLEPGQRGVATVTIAVPDDASEGERYGVIWAELRAVATAQEGIGAVNRVGVRMYLSIGPGGEPPTDFEITDIEGRRDEEGNPVVAAIVRNIGGRAVDLSGELRLTNGPGRLSAGPINADLGTTITAGQSGPVLFTLDPELPNGPWDAEIKMRSGATERTAKGTVTFPEEAGGIGEGSVDGDNLLWIIVGGIVGALLLAWFLFWFFRRRKKQREAEEAEAAAALVPVAVPSAAEPRVRRRSRDRRPESP